jgi:hypothetical protein
MFKERVDVFHPPALSFTQYSSTQQASPKGALNGKSNQKVLAGIRTADNGSFYHRLYRAVPLRHLPFFLQVHDSCRLEMGRHKKLYQDILRERQT